MGSHGAGSELSLTVEAAGAGTVGAAASVAARTARRAARARKRGRGAVRSGGATCRGKRLQSPDKAADRKSRLPGGDEVLELSMELKLKMWFEA
jgi:hypothetical protein